MQRQFKIGNSSRRTAGKLSPAALAPLLCGLAVTSGTCGDVILNPDNMTGTVSVIDFTSFDDQLIKTNGPVAIGEGVTWTAASEGWIGDMAFGLRTNGYWDWDMVGYVALNTSQSYMTITFDHPVSAVGGFVNYAPLEGFGPKPTIEALDGSGQILERFTMDVQTPGERNAGQFMGFIRENADIHQFRYVARYGVLDDLRFSNDLIPTPGAGFLLGLCGLALMGRRPSRRRTIA